MSPLVAAWVATSGTHVIFLGWMVGQTSPRLGVALKVAGVGMFVLLAALLLGVGGGQ